MSHINYSFQ